MKKAGIIYLKSVFPAFLLLLISFIAKAQRIPVDGLSNQIALYGLKNQSPVLFVHFDKNVYASNENVWLTAYLMNYTNAGPYRALSVALMRNADRAVVMQDRFVMNKGISFGNTVIPDTVAPGNYTFLVTTNRLVNGAPEMVFTQPITIKTKSDPEFTASLNALDTASSKAEQKIMLLVGVPGLDLKKTTPPQIAFRYYVGSSAHPLIHGEGKTDRQYNFSIPSNLLVPGNNLLHVQLTYKDQTRDLSMALPARPGPPVVRFFPEGGNLVDNILSTVGFEIRSAAGAPVGTSAFLYDNDKLTDTLQTNSYGLGRLTFTPQQGHNYRLKLYNAGETSFPLPRPLAAGPALAVNEAVVNDTLAVTIRDNQKEKLYLTGHNYREVFFTQPVEMTTGIKRLRLVISTLPKGLAELTLTDSLGRPFAERLFFAHYNKREPVIVTIDKEAYTTREKVNVQLKLDAALPDSALVSIACVQENRISLNKNNDIESYFYLKHDLGELPARQTYLTGSEADKQFMENLLLVKGWSRFTWTDMLRAQPADTVKQSSYLTFTGKVTWVADRPKNLRGAWMGTPLKKPVGLVNLNYPLSNITTGKTGDFLLNDAEIITEPDKLVNLIVADKEVKYYKTVTTDPYIPFTKTLAASATPEDHETQVHENSNYLDIPPNEHEHQLKEVKINGNNNDDFYGFRVMGLDSCLDYVCRFGYLNCSEHRDDVLNNRAPVVGQTYFIDRKGTRASYTGCVRWASIRDENVSVFKGIYTAREFYPSDYKNDTSSAPDYLSTIYWDYQVKLSSLKDTGLSFYTSDITGKFKIVVQGIAGNDVTYGESSFNVVKGK